MNAKHIGPGTLVAVVGPSGSGKDTLLRAARLRFADNPAIVFPQRAITRLAGDANEDHLPLTPEAFEHLRANGDFALDWDAHGLRYGIPATIDTDIAAGRTVVVNLSRTILPAARAHYTNCIAVAIAIDAETMRQRLIARGRESTADIETRIARLDLSFPEGFDTVIDNSGSLKDASEKFFQAVQSGLRAAILLGARL